MTGSIDRERRIQELEAQVAEMRRIFCARLDMHVDRLDRVEEIQDAALPGENVGYKRPGHRSDIAGGSGRC